MRTQFIIAAVGALALTGCGPQGGELTEPGPEEEPPHEVECFDADYPLEPTFATPEEALQHAVETDRESVPVPDDIGEYDRVERADGWIDFEFHENDNIHHTWGVTRDDDDRWGMTSLGGCIPAG